MKYRPTARTFRRISQVVFLLLFLVLFRKTDYSGSDALPHTLNLFFRWDPLVAVTAMLSSRQLVSVLLPSLGTVMLTVILGRVFCGWICPMGAVLDGLARYARAGSGSSRPRPLVRLRGVKYGLLVILLVSSLAGFQLVGFVDPIALLFRAGALAVDPMAHRAISSFFDGVYGFSPGFAERITEPVYGLLKHGVLPFRQSAFFLSSLSLALLVGIVALERIERRFWCRYLCPLGALLALFARPSFLRRIPGVSCRNCPQCVPNCRMNAFEPATGRLDHAECNLCMDCVDDCLNQSPRFAFTRHRNPLPVNLTRRALVGSALAGILLPWAARVNARSRRPAGAPLRPPGVTDEEDFLARCVRCGECMKVCIENALQPCFLEAGYEGMFSPRLVPRLGYCEFNCTLCGQVCPTGAIPRLALPDKQKAVIGTAVFDTDRCLPYARGVPCMVCEEHCPTGDKAIRFREGTVPDEQGNEVVVKLPYVREDLCIGCGICENKCPLPGAAAIRVWPAAGAVDGAGAAPG